MIHPSQLAHLKCKYGALVLWNEELGAKPYYIEDIVQEAESTNAPTNSIYKNIDGLWVTVAALPTNHPFITSLLRHGIPTKDKQNENS